MKVYRYDQKKYWKLEEAKWKQQKNKANKSQRKTVENRGKLKR